MSPRGGAWRAALAFQGLTTAALKMVTAGSVRWLVSAGTFTYVTGEGERADLYVEFAPGHGVSRAAGEQQVTNPYADLQARFVQVRHVRAEGFRCMPPRLVTAFQ